MKAYRFLILILLLASLLEPASSAQAHADLLRTDPPADAHLEQPPAQISLVFSEAVEPGQSLIAVYDSSGQRVDRSATRLDPADPTHVTAGLPLLKDGIYTVSWKVISADDAHLTGGSFVFYVGNIESAPAAQAGTAASGDSASPGQVLVKGLLYLACALLAGGTFFVLFIERPAIREVEAQLPAWSDRAYPWESRRTYRLFMAAGLVLAFLGSLLGILVQAALFQGKWLLPPWDPQAAAELTGTRYGLLTLWRVVTLLVLAGLLLPPRSRLNRWLALPFLGVLFLTLNLDSHAAAQPGLILPVAADFAHLAAASVWTGGLGLFLGSLARTRSWDPARRSLLAAALLTRFTALALVSLGVLALTGIYQALLDIGLWGLLVGTAYGQALLIKLLIALAMVALGGYHHFVINPRLQGANRQPQPGAHITDRFRKTLAIEALLGAGLLLWVGFFTSLPPARPAGPAQWVRTNQQNGLVLKLVISPGQVGINSFTVDATTPDGAPAGDIGSVEILFYSSNESIPPTEVFLTDLGGGRYQVKGGYLGYPDQWKLRVVINRDVQLNVVSDFSLNVRPPFRLDAAALLPPLLVYTALCCLLGIFFLASQVMRRGLSMN